MLRLRFIAFRCAQHDVRYLAKAYVTLTNPAHPVNLAKTSAGGATSAEDDDLDRAKRN